METLTLEQWRERLEAQGVPREHLAFKCPICGTVQSAHDLVAAGAGQFMTYVEVYLAFSCVGRWTGAPAHKKGDPPGRGCDWTLGGAFKLHVCEVIDETGRSRPTFAPASPEEAQAHWHAAREAAASTA